jgi:hypothetical protein
MWAGSRLTNDALPCLQRVTRRLAEDRIALAGPRVAGSSAFRNDPHMSITHYAAPRKR